jgi:methyl-accepting chemotaxis protein
MDKVTQQNAASAEESSSAASELNGQAEELAAMVGAFQLARQGGARPAQRKPTAALPAARHAPARAARANGTQAMKPPEKIFPMDDETELKGF